MLKTKNLKLMTLIFKLTTKYQRPVADLTRHAQRIYGILMKNFLKREVSSK